MKAHKQMHDFIALALAEDIGKGDITTESLLEQNPVKRAHIIAKGKGILCGVNAIVETFRLINSAVVVTLHKHDGMRLSKGDIVCTIRGPVHSILKGERVALNYLSYLSGISTLTNVYVQKVKGTSARIYDTRKTIPGYRLLEKYAVLTGGGCNQRVGLFDQVLIKDNHYEALGCISLQKLTALIQNVRTKIPPTMKIQVEADSLRLLRAILPAHPDMILLDNMNMRLLRKAISLIREESLRSKHHIEIEASGGITLRNVRGIAQLGVERISIGAITHSAPAFDFSLEVI